MATSSYESELWRHNDFFHTVILNRFYYFCFQHFLRNISIIIKPLSPCYIHSLEWKKNQDDQSVLKHLSTATGLITQFKKKSIRGYCTAKDQKVPQMITLKNWSKCPKYFWKEKRWKNFRFWISVHVHVRCLFSFPWNSPGKNRWCINEEILLSIWVYWQVYVCFFFFFLLKIIKKLWKQKLGKDFNLKSIVKSHCVATSKI